MSSGLSITVKVPTVKEIRAVFRQPVAFISEAHTHSVAKVADDAVKLGKVNIGASGRFRGAWVSGLRARKYPRKRPSMSPQAWIVHRFGGLASVFEFGATARPKARTYMWLPLPGTPKRTSLSTNFAAGRINKSFGRATIGRVSEKAGGLVPFFPKGGNPLLGTVVKSGKKKTFKPLFVGIKFASIRKRWSIQEIIRSQAQRLPALIENELNKAAKD